MLGHMTDGNSFSSTSSHRLLVASTLHSDSCGRLLLDDDGASQSPVSVKQNRTLRYVMLLVSITQRL